MAFRYSLNRLVVLTRLPVNLPGLVVHDRGKGIKLQCGTDLGDGFLVAPFERQQLGVPLVGRRVAGVQLDRPAESAFSAGEVPVK